MSEDVSERERLARALWLEFYDWTSSWEATDREQWRASADVLIAAGFGDVAQITAERDAAVASVATAKAEAFALASREFGVEHERVTYMHPTSVQDWLRVRAWQYRNEANEPAQ